MQKFLLVCVICLCAFTAKFTNGSVDGDGKNIPSLLASSESAAINQLTDSLYKAFHLKEAGLNYTAFFYAFKGYEYFLSKNMLQNTSVLTICDYSQSSLRKRLYVLDMLHGKLLYHTYVSHGKNSGAEYATSFSNLANSNKSPLGFLITQDTYVGKNGYSLRFIGTEKGINDNVAKRAVVMHGSAYVNAQRAASGSFMGRSWGCPAVSYEEHKTIINTIKGGSCFFIYAPNNQYLHYSTVLKAQFKWPVLQPGNLNASSPLANIVTTGSSIHTLK